jgi:hypothetical protein
MKTLFPEQEAPFFGRFTCSKNLQARAQSLG